jgi:hypothetical protein
MKKKDMEKDRKMEEKSCSVLILNSRVIHLVHNLLMY